MNEKRPDSSFRSADSKRKHGSPSSILAKAETGVSASATRSTINGMRLPLFASSRNSSRVGVMECWSSEVMGENLALVCHSATARNLRLRNEPAAPLFLSLKTRVQLSGRAPPCQGGRREFESRHPLHFLSIPGWL